MTVFAQKLSPTTNKLISEKEIDKAGFEILVRYQPVASELRQVVSAMKLSPNIERVADEATNIAEAAAS